MPTDAPSAVRDPEVRGAVRLARGALSMLLFAVPVVLLGYAVRQKFDPLVHLDDAVIRRTTDLTRDSGAVGPLRALQAASQPFLMYVLGTAVALWTWVAKGLRARAIWAFVTMMVAWNVGLLVKAVVQRARPVVQDPVSHSPGYSFPSGHAFNIAVVTTVLVFLLWPVLSRVGRRVAIAVALVVALVVGLDRMFLGVHYPSDVVAGWILGVGITFSSWLGFLGRTSPTSSHGPSHPA